MSSGNSYERLFKQWASVAKMVVDGTRDPKEVSGALQFVIEDKEIALAWREVTPLGREALLNEWRDFYQRYFGINADLSKIKFPKTKKDFNRPIVVAKDLTPYLALKVCEKYFPCKDPREICKELSLREDLGKKVTGHNARKPNQDYAIWIRSRTEADEELANLSAKYLEENGIQGITLLERLIFEIKHYDETGQHLDIHNWTLCTGSRYSDSGVPKVSWFKNELWVYGHFSRHALFPFRARAVISS